MQLKKIFCKRRDAQSICAQVGMALENFRGEGKKRKKHKIVNNIVYRKFPENISENRIPKAGFESHIRIPK
jgi:hypothetical protein